MRIRINGEERDRFEIAVSLGTAHPFSVTFTVSDYDSDDLIDFLFQ